jgi:hypothetical protein
LRFIVKTLSGYSYYPDSLVSSQGVTYFMARSEEDNAKFLGVLGNADGFEGFSDAGSGTLLCPPTPENLARLRERLPWLKPQALGVQTTAGFGDRLGLATPGHVRAVQGTGIAPIFAQQSVRENVRTRRTPQQVMDDAVWGVFQTGWHAPWGADADHLKTTEDIDSFFDAGFTFFTIDPGEHVDNAAQHDTLETLRAKVQALPWDQLQSTPRGISELYLDQVFQMEDLTIVLDETTLLRALAKYGRAVAHTVRMAEHLAARAGSMPVDLEISVDETETPTSPAEHFFVASELRRLGIRPTSMAPRFVGRFEKGVDYIGDLAEFEREFAFHAAIARHLGGYRLSLHSGSDKFSVYSIAAQKTNGLLHLKTAGTSYLEALRVVGQVDSALFRKILTLAIERYEVDRASYHVSAELSKVADPQVLLDTELAGLLDQFDARQIFHVTFGATLDRFGPGLCAVLRDNEDTYYNFLASHFKKHLSPIQKQPGA